jgi:hypothetical protein
VALTRAITDPDPAAAKRAFDAMMTMKKIDIAAIEAAAEVEAASGSVRHSTGHTMRPLLVQQGKCVYSGARLGSRPCKPRTPSNRQVLSD